MMFATGLMMLEDLGNCLALVICSRTLPVCFLRLNDVEFNEKNELLEYFWIVNRYGILLMWLL